MAEPLMVQQPYEMKLPEQKHSKAVYDSHLQAPVRHQRDWWGMLHWGMLLVLMIALVLFIIGYSTTGWAYHNMFIYKARMGLWRLHNCKDYRSFSEGQAMCTWIWMEDSKEFNYRDGDTVNMINTGSYQVYITGWIHPVQVIESLALVGYVGAVICLMLYIGKESLRDNKSCQIAFICLCMLSMFLSIIGAAIYAGSMMERCWYSSAKCRMGYSFALVITAAMLSMSAGSMKILEMANFFNTKTVNKPILKLGGY